MIGHLVLLQEDERDKQADGSGLACQVEAPILMLCYVGYDKAGLRGCLSLRSKVTNVEQGFTKFSVMKTFFSR